MVKIENTDKPYTYPGLKYISQNTTFRMRDLQKVIDIANNWMKEHYGDRFIGFELRSDFDNTYIARMKEFHPIGTHLNDTCVIAKTGTQYRPILHYNKPI